MKSLTEYFNPVTRGSASEQRTNRSNYEHSIQTHFNALLTRDEILTEKQAAVHAARVASLEALKLLLLSPHLLHIEWLLKE